VVNQSISRLFIAVIWKMCNTIPLDVDVDVDVEEMYERRRVASLPASSILQ